MTGLTTEEKGRVILSVGKGGAGGWRPLSPVQVGDKLKRCIDNGDSLQQLGAELKIGPDMIARFVRLCELPDDVRASVDWRGTPTSLSFSAAQHIARLTDNQQQRQLAELSIAQNLSSAAITQVLQRMKRSGADVKEAVDDIAKLTPDIEQRYVTIGTITEPAVRNRLSTMGSADRTQLLENALRRLLPDAIFAVRLTDTGFTISSTSEAHKQLMSLDPDFESAINKAVAERV